MATEHSNRNVAATIINAVGAILGIVLLLHIIFELVGANGGNPIVGFFARWADAFAIWFRDLFATGNTTVDMILNYGLAAIFWLIVAGLLARVIRQVR